MYDFFYKFVLVCNTLTFNNKRNIICHALYLHWQCKHSITSVNVTGNIRKNDEWCCLKDNLRYWEVLCSRGQVSTLYYIILYKFSCFSYYVRQRLKWQSFLQTHIESRFWKSLHYNIYFIMSNLYLKLVQY